MSKEFITASFYTVDNTHEFIDPVGKTFTLEELQALVKGPIEIIHSRTSPYIMVVNADGQFEGQRPNQLASKVMGIPLVGDCLFCHSKLVE